MIHLKRKSKGQSYIQWVPTVRKPTSFTDYIQTHRVDKTCLAMAASLGDLGSIKWLLFEKHCPFDWSLMDAALRNGCSENLEWLTEYMLAMPFQVSFAQSVHEHRVDESTFMVAALLGDLKCMIVLHFGLNCPYDSRLLKAAQHNGNKENLAWLKEHVFYK